MNIGELKEKLKDISDDTPVVVEQVYESIPIDRLEDGEYDDYGGMPNGKFSELFRVTHDPIAGHVQLDFL